MYIVRIWEIVFWNILAPMFEIFQYSRYMNYFRFFFNLCASVYVCAHAHIYVITLVCKCAEDREHWVSCYTMIHVIPLIHGLSVNLELLGFFGGGRRGEGGLGSNASNPLVSASPSPAPLPGIHLAMSSFFFLRYKDPNSGPHTIAVSTLLTKPSSQP